MQLGPALTKHDFANNRDFNLIKDWLSGDLAILISRVVTGLKIWHVISTHWKPNSVFLNLLSRLVS